MERENKVLRKFHHPGKFLHIELAGEKNSLGEFRHRLVHFCNRRVAFPVHFTTSPF